MPFKAGAMRPGFERLRVVQRADTARNIGTRVAPGIGLSLPGGGIDFGAQGFARDDLAGTTPDELAHDSVAANPAMTDRREALGRIAAAIYRRRMEEALATEVPVTPGAGFPHRP
ncbi:hypothetical protein ASF43_26405 [Pseudorhodoferax sp. Leaf267]|nr:hypothetical protein ASF43_26405 [Pseudorhodoferax sp. Leaf267]